MLRSGCLIGSMPLSSAVLQMPLAAQQPLYPFSIAVSVAARCFAMYKVKPEEKWQVLCSSDVSERPRLSGGCVRDNGGVPHVRLFFVAADQSLFSASSHAPSQHVDQPQTHQKEAGGNILPLAPSTTSSERDNGSTSSFSDRTWWAACMRIRFCPLWLLI